MLRTLRVSAPAPAPYPLSCFPSLFVASLRSTMQGYSAAQKEDLLVGLATLAINDGGVELSVRRR